MKPYIEYDGKKYEFEAGFKIQKEFKKEYKEKMTGFRKNLIENTDIAQIIKAKDEMEKLKSMAEKKKMTDKEIETETNKFMTKHPELLGALSLEMSNNDNDDINEKYCKIMFETKYPEEKGVFDKFCDEVCNDHGIIYLYQMFSSIITAVFTSVVQEQPLQNVSFGWEKK